MMLKELQNFETGSGLPHNQHMEGHSSLIGEVDA